MADIAVGVAECPFSGNTLEVQGQALARLAPRAGQETCSKPGWRATSDDGGVPGS